MSDALGHWIDGAAGAMVPADDRGLQYGDGLFETLLVRERRVRFLEAHLARLATGCGRLRIGFTKFTELRAEIVTAAERAPPLAVLKIVVTRGSAVRRGYAPQGSENARRIVSLWPAAPLAVADGVELRVAAMRASENPALAGIKHLNRLENVLAAAEPHATSVFDALMLDSSRRVIGGVMSNVFVVREGRLSTPRVDLCGVAGVMRGVVLRECTALAIPVTEDRIALTDLLTADEVFITNARIGVVPVRRVGEHSFVMNEITQHLRQRIEAIDA